MNNNSIINSLQHRALHLWEVFCRQNIYCNNIQLNLNIGQLLSTAKKEHSIAQSNVILLAVVSIESFSWLFKQEA